MPEEPQMQSPSSSYPKTAKDLFLHVADEAMPMMTKTGKTVKDIDTKPLEELFRKTQSLDQAKNVTEEQICQEIEDFRDKQKS